MKTITMRDRALAIIGGLLFTAGSLTILLEDALNGTPFGLKHAVTILTLAGTIHVGMLSEKAWRNGRWLTSFGLSLVAIVGTALVVFTSAGKQAETSMASESQSLEVAEQRAATRRKMASAEAMLTESQRELARECKTGKGSRCDGIRATIGVYEAAVKGHQADLDRLGLPKPVAAEAEQLGAFAAVFGADKQRVKAGSILIAPFARTLFFEFGAILCFGYGFRSNGHPRVTVRQSADRVTSPDGCQTSFPTVEPAELSNCKALFDGSEPNYPGIPDGSKPGGGVRLEKHEALAALLTELALGRGFGSQDELAERFGRPKSTVSEWLTEWQDAALIPARTRSGRCKMVGA